MWQGLKLVQFEAWRKRDSMQLVFVKMVCMMFTVFSTT